MDEEKIVRKKIAIVHPRLIRGGGSEPCALWAAEVLKKEYDISLVTMGEINLEELNGAYGTNLKEDEISVITIPLPKFFKYRFEAFRNKLPKFCKKISPKFDLMISTYNGMDFGKRGMQIIADLNFDEKLRKTYNCDENFKKWIYRDSLFRKIYLFIARTIIGNSEKNWKKNFTISLSKWLAEIIKDKFGIDSIVIYPPVAVEFPDVPWDRRENGFVFIGRICPEKEVDKVIRIIKSARENDINIHLHIVGRIDERFSNYAKFIKELCIENRNWCFFEGELYGQKKLDFIAGHKYGISGRSNEPWGIAIAEMVKAGCIVFVSDGGGQTEIVCDDNLIYADAEDAVEKIKKITSETKLQDDLRNKLSANTHQFSIEKYKEEIKKAAYTFFNFSNVSL